MIIYEIWTYSNRGESQKHSSYLNRAAAEMVKEALEIEGIYRMVRIEEVHEVEEDE